MATTEAQACSEFDLIKAKIQDELAAASDEMIGATAGRSGKTAAMTGLSRILRDSLRWPYGTVVKHRSFAPQHPFMVIGIRPDPHPLFASVPAKAVYILINLLHPRDPYTYTDVDKAEDRWTVLSRPDS